jgi:hypothetical protein
VEGHGRQTGGGGGGSKHGLLNAAAAFVPAAGM